MIVLLRCNNTELFDRLQARGYKQEKIEENIECEIYGELKDEVEESYKHDIIMELQSSEVDDVQNNMNAIAVRLKQICEDKKVK